MQNKKVLIGWACYLFVSISINHLYRFPVILIIIETSLLYCIWTFTNQTKQWLCKRYSTCSELLLRLEVELVFWAIIAIIFGLLWGAVLVEVLYPIISNDSHYLSGENRGTSVARYTWGRITDAGFLLFHLAIIQKNHQYDHDKNINNSKLTFYIFFALVVIFICRLATEIIYQSEFNFSLSSIVTFMPLFVGVGGTYLLINKIMVGEASFKSASFHSLYLVLIILLVPLSFPMTILVNMASEGFAHALGVDNSFNQVLNIGERSKQDIIRVLAGNARQIFHYSSFVCALILLHQYQKKRPRPSETSFGLMPRSREFWFNNLLAWMAFTVITYITDYWHLGDLSVWNLILIYMPTLSIGIVLSLTSRLVILVNIWVLDDFKKLAPRILLLSIAMGLTLFIWESFFSIVLESFSVINFEQYEKSTESILLENKSVYFKVILYILLFFIWCFVYSSFLNNKNKQDLILRNEIMENENRNFELSLLKNQLDPHFIFNTLTGIRYLILQNPAKARLCLESLSDLIRENLKLTNWEKVSVEKEISLVSAYIDLMKIQLEEKLDYRQEIDIAVKHCIIPTMLIQMLVENAIKHGVARMTTTGFVKLSVMIKSENVTITVENSINPDASGKSEGFGLSLKNIKKRLKLIYGVQSSFLFNILGSTAKITIILPKEKT